jgi:hypothetical protein
MTLISTSAVPGGAASFSGTFTLDATGNWTGTLSYTVPSIYVDATIIVQIEDANGNATSAGQATVPAGGSGTVGVSVSQAAIAGLPGGKPWYLCIYVRVPPTKLLLKEKLP